MIALRPYPLPRPGYTVPEFGGRLNGLGNWLSDLFGKPQTWYDRVDRDQKALAVRAAEVNAIGQAPWDSVRTAYFESTQGPDTEFLSFSDINDGIGSRLKALLVTKSHTPSDEEISDAEAYNAQYGRYADYVKQMLPELAAQANADAAEVRSMLSQNSMRSPAEVGEQAFEDEVARRAKILGGVVGGGMLLYLAIPALVALALSGRSRR